MAIKLAEINKIELLIKQLEAGNTISDEEKTFLKQVLDEKIEEIQDDHSIVSKFHLLLIAIGDREFAEHIFRKELKYGFELEDRRNYERGIGITPAYTFREFGDKEYLKKILFDESFFFTGYQKQMLLEEIGDKELIKMFIDDSSLGLGALYRQNLIEVLYDDDPEMLKKYLFAPFLNIDSLTKTDWIIKIEDEELTNRFIRDASLGLNSKDRARLIKNQCDGDIQKLNAYFTDESLNLDSYLKCAILTEMFLVDETKEELVERYIKDSSLGIKSEDKINLIALICDIDINKAEKFIFDDSINLSSKNLVELLSWYLDKNVAKKVIKNPNLRLSNLEKVKVAKKIKDWDFIKELVRQEPDINKKIEMLKEVYDNEDLIIDFLRNYTQGQENKEVWSLVNLINTPEKIEEFIEHMKKQNAEVIHIEKAIRKINNTEIIKKWDEERLAIRDSSELTLEQLEQNNKIKYVVLEPKDGSNKIEGYTRKQYIEIRRQLDRILDGEKRPKKDDFISELEAFKTIFKRLSHIEYDEYAITDEGKRIDSLGVRCRNLYNGLVLGKCVCVGYSIILKACLNLIGIDAKIIGGYGKENDDEEEIGHAWNQVKIGGVWFNCDLTNYCFLGLENDGKYAYRALKSDKEFKDNKNLYKDRFKKREEICDIRIEEMLLRSYVRKVAHSFGINEIKETFRSLQDKMRLLKNRFLHKEKIDKGKDAEEK